MTDSVIQLKMIIVGNDQILFKTLTTNIQLMIKRCDMAKIIRINVNTDCITEEGIKEQYELLGGRALTSQIIFDEVDPECHPLGPNNKLILAPGFLTGTGAPCSARLSAGGKSPLTGGIKESNAGGNAALMMARLGIKAIILEGDASDNAFRYVYINKDGISLKRAEHLHGRGNYGTVAVLQEQHGAKVGIISIGQAGEERLHSASIAVTTCKVTHQGIVAVVDWVQLWVQKRSKQSFSTTPDLGSSSRSWIRWSS